MSACFLPALSEVIRLATPDVVDDPEITVTLDPVPDQGNRARVGARFWVAVSLSWAGDPWGSGVQVVDSRGYPVVWKYADVAKWMVKALSGAPCVVTVTITDAAHVPARWTDARAAAAAAKVAGLDAADVEAAAAAKVASVSAWANSQRKRDVIAAADNMNSAAGLLRIAQAVQGGAALGDPLPVDPPPVDPPPVDPPPVDPAPAGFEGAVQVVNGELSGVRFISASGDVLVWRFVHPNLSVEGAGFTVQYQGAGVPAMGDPIDVYIYDQSGNQIGMAAYGNGLFFGAAGVTAVYLRTYGVSGYGQAFGGVNLTVTENI